MKYTITTTTSTCPYCGRVISRKTSGAFTPILSIFAIFFLPFFIMFLIMFIALKSPYVPSVGPKTEPCPHCNLPIKTGYLAVEELTPREAFIYRFRWWLYSCYALSEVSVLILAYIFIAQIPIVSLAGFGALLCFLGAVAIAITYRVKLAKYKEPERSKNTTQTRTPKPKPVMPAEWKCTCGRTNPPYVSTCNCGMSKIDAKKLEMK